MFVRCPSTAIVVDYTCATDIPMQKGHSGKLTLEMLTKPTYLNRLVWLYSGPCACKTPADLSRCLHADAASRTSRCIVRGLHGVRWGSACGVIPIMSMALLGFGEKRSEARGAWALAG